MKPNDFWNCTYRELYLYVKSNSLQREEDYKKEIILFDALGNKLLNVLASKRPKNTSLVKETFAKLFKEELDTSKVQSVDEQLRILRSMCERRE